MLRAAIVDEIACEDVDAHLSAAGDRSTASFPPGGATFCGWQRTDELFGQLWSNTDAADSPCARRLLTGRYSWLEDGIIDPSIPGPWIATAEPGPSQAADVHRHIG